MFLLFLVCFSFFFPQTSFSPHLYPKGEFVNCHWTVGYLRRLCHVVVAVWLSLAGSGWALHPMASRMSLRIWYWGREQTCRGANPSDGHSGDSESQWGTFPWREATEIWNGDRQEGNRLQGRDEMGEKKSEREQKVEVKCTKRWKSSREIKQVKQHRQNKEMISLQGKY